MKNLYTEKKKTLILRSTDVGLLFVIGLYVLAKDITKTTLKLGLASGKDKYIIMMLAVLVTIRLAVLLIEDKEKRNTWIRFVIIALVVDAALFCMWHAYPADTLVILALLNLGLIGFEYRKVLKAYIIAAAMAVFPAIVMAWIGAIDNFVYIRYMTIRSSWGIKYPTDMMSLLFFLLLAVWVVHGRKGGLWFLIPGFVFALMAWFVADSRTGVFCGLLFIAIICIEPYLSHVKPNKLTKLLEIFACGTFPFFTVVMNGLVIAYRQGNPIAVKLNGILSDRLALSVEAINKYGIGIWGRPLEMTGWGGSAFARPEYFFVDISYVQVLIRFGVIALVILNILWVLMTRKAFKIRDTRLALALSLIAVNCAIEHHVLQLNYDIFIVISFAILSVQGTENEYSAEEILRKKTGSSFIKVIEKLVLVAGLAVGVTAVVLVLLPKARTVISLTGIAGSEKGRRLLVLVIWVGLFLAVEALSNLYKMLLGAIKETRQDNKLGIIVIAAFVIVVCMTAAASNILITRGAAKNAELIESERDVIDLVQESKSGKLYAVGMPAVYSKAYDDISSSLFDGEELARYRNTSVIIDKTLDSPCFFNTGFLYTPISEKHALYTNDEPVIRSLERGGYHLTGFYPLETQVELADLADKNDVGLNEDGSITLHGEEESLHKGPGADLREGKYTVSFELKLDSAFSKEYGDEVCRLITSFYKDKYELNSTVITSDYFDGNGEYTADIVVDFPDAENTYFCIYPIGANSITVKGISYQKTPAYDTHAFYNEKKKRNREEYFDLNGVPYNGYWGYSSRELESDSKGNVVKESYFDTNGNKTLSSSGYHEIKRIFDDLGRITREDFYDIEGKLILTIDGYASREPVYEGSSNNIIYYKYFDTAGNEIELEI